MINTPPKVRNLLFTSTNTDPETRSKGPVMVSFEFPFRSGVEVRAKGAPSQYDKITAKFVYSFGASNYVNAVN